MSHYKFNWSRFNFLSELESDISGWAFSDPKEEEKATEVIKKIQEYKAYMLKDFF